MTRERVDIYVDRHVTGGFTLSTIHGGYRCHKLYIGWTLREARVDFRRFVKNG